ncbi:protein containing ATPase, P-type cation-transporter, partial [mine drainage metagenome]
MSTPETEHHAVPDNAQPARAGLTANEAAVRLAHDGPNLLPGAAPKTAWAIVLGVLREPMFLMLLAAGAS